MTQQAILFAILVVVICGLTSFGASLLWPRRTPSDTFSEPFGDVPNAGGTQNE